MLFLIYQQNISQSATTGKKPSPDFQTATVNLLKDEIKKVYGKIPAVIYVYQYEALNNADKKEEAQMAASEGLKEYPDSVPLKVYSYLSTHNETTRNDLVKNHPNHWMVKQYGIK